MTDTDVEILRTMLDSHPARPRVENLLAELAAVKGAGDQMLKDYQDTVKQLAAVTEERNGLLQTCKSSLEKLSDQGEEIAALKAERDRALATCAEMRKILIGIQYSNQNNQPIPWLTVGEYISHSLSTDCGKGYVPVSELEPTIELLKNVGWRPCGCPSHWKYHQGCPVGKEIERLESFKGGKG